ncbi:MAG: DUF3488 domain-containing protein [Deltaproteobacteria bacterium]|nr:DUF3488 domain-containing protein [Deltaproteobacteria bacterium]
MRFSSLHKLCAYLTVGSALAAVLLSPELSPAARLLPPLALLLSWFAEPPRWPTARLAAAWNVATLVFLLVQGAQVLSGAPLIEAGVHFLLAVLVNKLFNRRTSKDYQQLYVVSLLLLVAGTVLNTSLSYAVCFVLYVVFATWALILFHLRREMEENYLLKHGEDERSERVDVERIFASRRIVGPGFLAGTSLISLVILLGSVLLFTFFPRVGFGLFFGQKRGGVMMAGFREQVALGQHGTVRDNPKVVMRIVFPEGKRPPLLYFRGSVYDAYRDGTWSHGAGLAGTTVPIAPTEGLYLVNPAPGLPAEPPPRLVRERLLRQEVYLEPLDSTVLFGADRPVAVEVPRPPGGLRPPFLPRRGPHGELRADRVRTAGVHYVVFSQPKRPAAPLLRSAEALEGPRLARFLRLPPELPERVRALGRRLVASDRTVYDKVLAVQRYLTTNYRYTLALQHQPGREPVDEFLFETRQGHCEYFASAFAVLLRAGGVHARNVNGFAGGEWNGYGKYLAVREGDAHAWTEVLFPNVGWVAFDATPTGAVARPAPAGFLNSVTQLLDTLRLRWFRYVVEYDLGKQVALFRRAERLVSGRGAKREGSSWFARHRRLLLGAGGAALACLLVVVAWRRRRRRGSDPVRGEARGRPHPAAQLYRRATALLTRAGRTRPESVTPREFARALAEQRFPAAPLVGDVTDCYYRARFSPVQGARAELETLSRLVGQLELALREAASAPAAGPRSARRDR